MALPHGGRGLRGERFTYVGQPQHPATTALPPAPHGLALLASFSPTCSRGLTPAAWRVLQAYLHLGCFLDVRASAAAAVCPPALFPSRAKNAPSDLRPAAPQPETGERAPGDAEPQRRHGYSPLDTAAACAIAVSWVLGRGILFGWLVRAAPARRGGARIPPCSLFVRTAAAPAQGKDSRFAAPRSRFGTRARSRAPPATGAGGAPGGSSRRGARSPRPWPRRPPRPRSRTTSRRGGPRRATCAGGQGSCATSSPPAGRTVRRREEEAGVSGGGAQGRPPTASAEGARAARRRRARPPTRPAWATTTMRMRSP